MIRLKGIDHVAMMVKNLEQSIQFYQKLFGFELKQREELQKGPHAIIGVPGQLYLCLYQDPESFPEGHIQRIKHFGLNVSDIDQAYQTAKELGVAVNYGGFVEYENSRSLYIEDPSGYEIELSEHFGGALD